MAKIQKLPTRNAQSQNRGERNERDTSRDEPAFTRNGNRYMECMNVVEKSAADGGPGRKFWTKLGYAFENANGTWNLELNAMPADMRIHMCNPRRRDETGDAGKARAAA